MSITAKLLTAEEAATYLRLSKGTIYNLAYQGRIPKCYAGRSLRFEIEALNRWIKDGHSTQGEAGERKEGATV